VYVSYDLALAGAKVKQTNKEKTKQKKKTKKKNQTNKPQPNKQTNKQKQKKKQQTNKQLLVKHYWLHTPSNNAGTQIRIKSYPKSRQGCQTY
jgi:outer membrane biosynthesis protein TonB